MRKAVKAVTAVVFVTGALATAGATSAQAATAAGSTIEGCKSGYVCIYPEGAGWNGGVPESSGTYYTYGAHALKGQKGDHYVFNNQTGEATAQLCTGDGTGCGPALDAGYVTDADLTPINYILLEP